MNSLLVLFDCENYLLRQAITKVLQNIIIFVLHQPDVVHDDNGEIDAAQTQQVAQVTEQTKLHFLDILM